MRWRREATNGFHNLTQERSGHTATLCGNYVFVLGGGMDGLDDSSYVDAVYNLNTKQWAFLGSNTNATFHSTSLVDDRLICVGGVDNWNEVEEQRDMLVVVVDLIQGTSEEVETFTREGAAKPAHTFKHVGKYFASKREIVVHGGRPDLFEDIYSSQLFALEVDRMTWRQLSYHGKPPLQQSSHMGCVNPKGDRMFVFASYEVEPQRSELYLFDYTGRIPMWTLIETQGSVLPGYYGGCMDMVDSGQIVIYGGLVDGNSCDELLTYNISSSTWKEGKPTPTAVREFEFNVDGEVPAKRVRHASIVWNGTIIYFGGECTVGEPLDDLMVLEL